MSTREAFEANLKHLDYSLTNDAWGNKVYQHTHVRSLWDGWQACQAHNDTVIAELETKLKLASDALENIVKHFDLMGKSITKNSITYRIATETLAKNKGQS